MRSLRFAPRQAAIFVAAMVTVLLAGLGAPAGAVSNGTVDETTHPQVGALLADFGEGLERICSGTLISARVFLTAGHCTAWLPAYDIDEVFVTFDPSWSTADPGTFHRGVYVTHPGYGYTGQGGFSDPNDLSVVVLDEAITGITPARLPAVGALDRMALRSQPFTAVGYGMGRDIHSTGPQALYPGGTRMWATGTFRSLQPAWVSLSQNIALGDGGGCFGDSGGPSFVGDSTSNRLAATITAGDSVCVSLSKTYRLDTESAAAFLGEFDSYAPFSYWGTTT